VLLYGVTTTVNGVYVVLALPGGSTAVYMVIGRVVVVFFWFFEKISTGTP